MNNQAPKIPAGTDDEYQKRVNDVHSKILAAYQLMVDNIRFVLKVILNLKKLRDQSFPFSATLTFNHSRMSFVVQQSKR